LRIGHWGWSKEENIMSKRKRREENWSKIQPLQPHETADDGYDYHPPFKEVDHFVGEVDKICEDHGFFVNVTGILCPTQFFLQNMENPNENYYVRTRGHHWSVTQVNKESFQSGDLVMFEEVETVSHGEDTFELRKGVVGIQPMATIAEGTWDGGLRTLTDLLMVVSRHRFNS
jgi:hypothetical protein